MSVRDQFLGAARHADRLIPFGNLDPRWLGNKPTATSGLPGWFLMQAPAASVRSRPTSPPMTRARSTFFQQIGSWASRPHPQRGVPARHLRPPVTPACPGWRSLQSAPDTIIIGHGQGFWAEIAADVTPETKMGPQGPVTAEGALPGCCGPPQPLCRHSANSGYNALTRTPEFGIRFLNEFQDKLLFGTDHLWPS